VSKNGITHLHLGVVEQQRLKEKRQKKYKKKTFGRGRRR
jgi:hypothetical protein